MPAKSPAQYRFMAGVAHGMKPRSGSGPSREVAEEFVYATPAKKRSRWSSKRKRSGKLSEMG